MNNNLLIMSDISIRINGNDIDWGRVLIFLFVSLVVLLIISLITKRAVFSKDNNLPLEHKKGIVVEKLLSQMNVEWYTVEFENGEKKRLRNLNSKSLVLSAGDEGLIEYRGNTICSFHRAEKR